MATTPKRLGLVVDAHAARRESLLAALLKVLLGLWGAPSHRWTDWEMAGSTIARTLVVLDKYNAEVRLSTRAMATQVLRDMDAPAVGLPPLRELYPRSGVTALEVYKRPMEQYAYAKTAGASDEEARDVAMQRLEDLVREDMALMERDEAQRVYAASPKVTGRRRIIHPERSRTGPCGLCVVAATRTYYVDELMPLHGGCQCTDAPIVGEDDPGLQLNQDDLERIYDAAGSTAAADLKRTRIEVREHGELGPVLVRAGQNFRDIDQVNSGGSRRKATSFARMNVADQRVAWTKVRDTSLRAIERLTEAKENGSDTVNFGYPGSTDIPLRDVDQAIKFHRDLVQRYAAKLA